MLKKIWFSCFPQEPDNEIIDVANKHSRYVLELQKELKTYIDFYNAIIENEVIIEKFKEYEKKIKELEIERDKLLQMCN
tara:strand:+ start:1512 stop:1748 length:237 start_codon:yes stop_codon:yes gene_type:complete